MPMRFALAFRALGVRLLALFRPGDLGDHHRIVKAVKQLRTQPVPPPLVAPPSEPDCASDGDLSAVVSRPRDIAPKGVR